MALTRKANRKDKSKSKTKTKLSSKSTPRKIWVVNKTKEDTRNKRRQQAAEGLSKARKKLEDTKKRIAEMEAEKAKLEESAGDTESEEDAAAARAKILKLDKRIKQNDMEMRDIEEEEKRFNQEVKDSDMVDVTEEQEVNDAMESSSE